jgi:hypothetical protein
LNDPNRMAAVAELRQHVHESRDLSTPDASTIDVRPLLAPPRAVPQHSDTGCSQRRVSAGAWAYDDDSNNDNDKNNRIDVEELRRLAAAPLSGVSGASVTHRDETRRAPTTLPVALDDHPAARSAVAQNMLERLAADAALYAAELAKSRVACLAMLDESTLDAIARGQPAPAASLVALKQLLERLAAQQASDANAVARGVAAIDARANRLPTPSGSIEQRQQLAQFQLKRFARLVVPLSVAHVTGALLSTKADDDLRAVNPFLSSDDSEAILSASAIVAFSMIYAIIG